MKRTSAAQWRGDGKADTGSLGTQSGAFTAQPYSFNTRFVSEDRRAGTNPEELMAAAASAAAVFLPSIPASGIEYDLLSLKGDRLWLGERSGDLAKQRPGALSSLALVRR